VSLLDATLHHLLFAGRLEEQLLHQSLISFAEIFSLDGQIESLYLKGRPTDGLQILGLD